MTEAQKILKMIENVSPDDTDKLDEIDAKVWCWLNKVNINDVLSDGERYWAILTNAPERLYSRSRDALKAIRPENWVTMSHEYPSRNVVFSLYNSGNDIEIDSPSLPKEELAELHAIIQAIEYERSGKK